jgi:hypothetical protein
MIIVEGPDGAGKTTLIRQLQEKWPDLEVAPRVVSKDAEAMVDLQTWVNDNLSQGPQYKIFDRHRLISEFIYGPILRTEQQPGFTSVPWVWHSLRRLERLRPVMIYCLPPLDAVMANIVGDNDNRVVWNHIMGIYTAYVQRATLDALHNGAIIYDYTTDGREDNPLNIFERNINNMRERVNHHGRL